MYKVINGHKYDTEAAREMAHWEASCSTSDFGWSAETLYRTKTGLYFLRGEGGPRTRYARADGDMWGWGERILPLTEDAARAWAEEHCDGRTYERIFGAPEAGPVRQLNIKLSRRDTERLEEIKRCTGRTYTELISGWIWSQEI